MAVARGHLIEFFFDIVSPFSFLAFETLTRYSHASPDAFELRMRPFFLGGVMKESGNSPPATVAAKAMYMMVDLQRNSQYFDVPLQQPSNFPVLTLGIQRVLIALAEDPANRAELERTMRFAWHAYWQQDRDITKAEVIKEVLTKAGIEDPQHWLERSADPAVKQRLVDNTSEAVKRGAFGAPTIFVTKQGQSTSEMYFGSDRFHFIMPSVGLEWQGPVLPPKAKL